MQTITILIADDHDLVRAGFRNLVNSLPGYEVVGEAQNGQKALDQIDALQPDIVLMDITMPVLNGLEATRFVVKKYPQVRVVILSMHDVEEYVVEALRAGAVGYLLKDASVDELARALKAASTGKMVLSEGISAQVLRYFKEDQKTSGLATLTDRQREVLRLIGEGFTTYEIANQLCISPKTVGAHRKNIMERLEIYDIPGLIRYAIQKGVATTFRIDS